MIQIGPYCWRAAGWAYVLLIVALMVFLRAAYWQWHKAELKNARIHALQKAQAYPAQPFDPAKLTAYHRVSLQGVWQPQYAIWLDNQVRLGMAGRDQIVPLLVMHQGKQYRLLVDRGWLAMGAPEAEFPSGVVTLEATVLPFPVARLELTQEVVTGRVWQNLTHTRYESRFLLKVLPWLVRQQTGSEHSLNRDWPQPDEGRDKNLSYAGQWLLFAVLALVLFVVLNAKRVNDE